MFKCSWYKATIWPYFPEEIKYKKSRLCINAPTTDQAADHLHRPLQKYTNPHYNYKNIIYI